MFNLQTLKTIIKGFNKASPTPTCYQFSLKYSTVTSDQCSFTVSYLINNCGFSPEAALKASKHVRFDTSEKPDSVLAFFRIHGFSDSQILSIIRREPSLLSRNPHKRLLPKFEFLQSKGASTSDIVYIITFCPRLLDRSLENHIIPTYELVNCILQSDHKVICCLKRYPYFVVGQHVAPNLKLLRDNGVTNSNIAILLRRWPGILCSCSSDLMESLEELKELEFDPLKSTFIYALIAKKSVTKSKWDAKVAAFKSWGWSENNILEAFRKQPQCMLVSKQKINALMSFWVNQLGWNSLAPVGIPTIFGYSLEKRIIPRALVIQYLLSKGLRNMSASILTPLTMSEKLFVEKFVMCFEGEEVSQLLRLYQESLNKNLGNDGV